MSLYCSSHAIYDCLYHVCWRTKYRRKVLTPVIQKAIKNIFNDIATEYDFRIDRLGFDEDHLHILVQVPPRWSLMQITRILKSISSKYLFRMFPNLKKQYWHREFWKDGYCVKTVGDELSRAEVRKYVENQGNRELF